MQHNDDFQSKVAIFPSVVQAYTQPYSFSRTIKLIICQIRQVKVLLKKLWLSYVTLWRILHLDLHLISHKVQLTQHWSQLTIHNIVNTWNGIGIFWTKVSLAMKHISHSMVLLINEIVVFGVLRILKQLKRDHYIQKKSLFGALFGPKVRRLFFTTHQSELLA